MIYAVGYYHHNVRYPRAFFFHHECTVYDVCKYVGTLLHEDRIRLSAFYTMIPVSLLCRLTWRDWTYNMIVRYVLWSVCRVESVFSVCFQLTHISCNNSASICVLYLIMVIKSEIPIISHFSGLDRRRMVYALSFWYVLKIFFQIVHT